MTNFAARAVDRLRTLFAPRGRHRAGQPLPPPPPPALARRPGPYATDIPIDGLATAMVRPYLLTAEQRQRRRALWPATYGIDVGPRRIHGVAVAR
ncbi:hypothetical protein [Streptomyces sp. ISL-100]|uniref:hypothetical protein n=1 Tax=Streptomyces sp. ISL-100 TaxID=2819173 RepID=UPI001BEA9F60|nr:hypothetical protein [Streptomyces sp. ISL-100]MBT2399715.1 hypothetical protein [Streptomyces sp. ISL-100]